MVDYRTQGDVVKKAALKSRLMEKSGGKCQRCSRALAASELQMHRRDPGLAHVRSQNFGYVESNVLLLCARCHDDLERERGDD